MCVTRHWHCKGRKLPHERIKMFGRAIRGMEWVNQKMKVCCDRVFGVKGEERLSRPYYGKGEKSAFPHASAFSLQTSEEWLTSQREEIKSSLISRLDMWKRESHTQHTHIFQGQTYIVDTWPMGNTPHSLHTWWGEIDWSYMIEREPS